MAEYVSNKQLYSNIKEYNELLKIEADGNKLTKAQRQTKKEHYESFFFSFQRIAKNYLNKPQFRKYTEDWKEDMISDAIVTCITKLDKFDTKYDNPFAYFTQVAKNSFKNYLRENNKYLDDNISVDFYDTLGSGISE